MTCSDIFGTAGLAWLDVLHGRAQRPSMLSSTPAAYQCGTALICAVSGVLTTPGAIRLTRTLTVLGAGGIPRVARPRVNESCSG